MMEKSVGIPVPFNGEKKYIPKSKPVFIGVQIGLAILLVGIYYPTFIWMWDRWFAADSYYSHGILIPIISVAFVWLKRKQLAKTPISSSKVGLAFLGMGLLLHIASAITRVHFTSGFSLILVLLGLILYLFGKEVTRILLFPILFLFFMVPAPMQVIAMITLKMKLFVAEISTKLISLLGIIAIREGSTVYMQDTSIVVADECSGLRTLVSLSALIVFYVYLVKASYLRRIALVMLSVPVAIIANVIRVMGVLIVANSYGSELVTTGMLDKVFGFIVFVIALAGMVIAGKALGCRINIENAFNFKEKELGNEIRNNPSSNLSAGMQENLNPPHFALHTVILALPLLFTALLTFRAYSTISYSGELYTKEIPLIIEDWYGQNLPISEREYEILETRDVFTRKYVNPNGDVVFFMTVFAQSNRKVAHPPEVCLRGGGWNISPAGSEIILLEENRKRSELAVNKLLMERPGEKQVVLYVYKAGDVYTTNYYRQQLNVVLNGIFRKNTSAALIEIIVPISEDNLQEATAIAKKFAKLVLPILSERLP